MRLPSATARLTFRPIAPSDLDFIAAMLGDSEVMRHYPKVYSRDEAASWIDRVLWRYARDERGLWLVCDRQSGEPRGQVGLLMQELAGVRHTEVGYLVHRPYWRVGLATEAARAVRDFALDELGEPHVISLIRPENLPSRGVATKLGMTVVGQVQHSGFVHDVWRVRRSERPAP